MSTTPTVSRRAVRAGRIVSALPVLFLLVDSAMKFSTRPEVVDGTRALGWDPSVVPALGIITLVGLALHLLPPHGQLCGHDDRHDRHADQHRRHGVATFTRLTR